MHQTAALAHTPALARISVEDFHRVSELGIYDKRAELIRGVVFQKPPLSPLHRDVSTWLRDYLYDLRLPRCLVLQEAPLTLRDSEPIPDVAVIAGSREDFRHCHPTTAELVIEVAVSSVVKDHEMAAIYAEAGVKEYWIVLPEERRVEAHRRCEGGVYRERQIFAGDEEIASTALPAVRVSLSALFA
jgi:Uma2 family endonuclease